MIKLFRNIRKNHLSEGKTTRYFKYAIGEIILVVIGILIALAINQWNQNRLTRNQEVFYLENLKNELINNIEAVKETDKLYEVLQESNEQGLNLLNNINSIKEIKIIDSLMRTYWTTFKVNRSTYNEMLNTGSFYSLHDKVIRDLITAHYVKAEGFESAFLEMNSNGQDINNNTDLFPLEILKDRLNRTPVDLKNIDTSWVHNPNSKLYIAYFKRATFFKTLYDVRRKLITSFIKNCEELIGALNEELENLSS